ncbi:MAG: sigma-70 family RNA polymerase sigma factor [Sedimentisphaerales bacterium]|nr:sigma-70 family RNA polymerase sigma factor [Sedimentisphaerales bacterium]
MNDNDLHNLVSKARQDNKAAQEKLAEKAGEKLYEYIFRHTQRIDITEDIVQECLIKMFHNLQQLTNNERIWPWLRTMAFNEICNNYKREKRHRKHISISEIDEVELNKRIINYQQEAALSAIQHEQRHVIMAAMKKLKPRYRDMIFIRCYEGKDYNQIAEELGCSELAVRTRFWRAKNALKRELAHGGLKKGALLSALLLFGKITARSEAAAAGISITSSTLKVGTVATVAGALGTKTGIISLTAAGVIAIGTTVQTIPPKQNAPREQLTPSAAVQHLETVPSVRGNNEYWYFYPEGAQGPLWMKLWLWDRNESSRKTLWLQNSNINCYFNGNTPVLVNHHVFNPDLSVWRLPTDTPALSRALGYNDAYDSLGGTISNRSKNLWIKVRQYEDEYSTFVQPDYQYEIMEQEYFQPTSPAGADMQDLRDTMHKRGWTYFIINGRMLGERLTGKGRIPFTYSAWKEKRPWLRLQVGNRLEIVDGARGAYILNHQGDITAAFPAESFFKSLLRPWMGLHTIDSIRREAARQEMGFITQQKNHTKAIVEIDYSRGKLIYSIDLDKDLIDTITLTGEVEGEIELKFLDDCDRLGSEFRESQIDRYAEKKDSEGWLWLMF